ncbi:11855_t:CDS:2, partial [Dentiscutata heterogama]
MSSELEYQNLVLEKATSEQARITNRNSYMNWGYPQLTIDEYIEREEILANNEFTLESFKVWILVSKKCILSKDTELTIFSQCETYKLKALITLSSGQIQEVIGYYITSLFTPAQLGWRIFPHKEIKFKVDDRFSTSLKHSELIVAINQSNLETIINTNDQRQFGAMISNKKKESYNKKEELFERFIMWNHDFRGNQLFIIRFRCDSPYSTCLLIQQAIQEA